MPLRSEFASGRSQLPLSSSSVAVASGGATTASYTLYFSLQGENQIGLNLPAAPIGPFTVAPGQRLIFTVPADAKLPGESWQNFVLSASTSPDLTTFVQVAKLPGDRQLPATITLTGDDAFALSQVVPTPSALPPQPINGQLRGVTSLNYVYEYVENSALTVDGTTVLAAPVGRWLRSGATFSTYVDDIAAGGGCAQDIRDIDESQVRVPGYACDRSAGQTTRFWLHNDSGASEPAGKRVGLVVQFNGETKTQAFHGLLKLVFRGYVNTVTGELRTTRSDGSSMPGVDEEVRFQANKSNLILPDDLQPDEAYALDVTPSFDAADLGGAVVDAAVVKVFPFLYSQAGTYSEAGAVIGDVIYAEGDRRLIVPDLGLTALALSGSGMVDSFSFLAVGATDIPGLAANTANQAIAIDHDGDVAVRSFPLPTTEALRALVGTVNGMGNSSDWSSAVTVSAGSLLNVTCNYPCNAGGIGTIRSSYPDKKIAFRNGKFNPTRVVIYVKQLSDNQIRRFSGYIVIPGTSQIFTIDSWAAGTVIAALPTNPDLNFGLFAPTSCAIAYASSSTDLVAGSYQAAFAFEYENAITNISHEEERGCILTAAGSIADLFAVRRSWGESVADIDALKALELEERYSYQCRPVINTPSGTQQYTFFPEASEGVKPTDLSDTTLGRWLPVNKGFTPTLSIGTVTSVDDPNGAAATLGGTLESPVLNFVIPRGQRGKPGIGIPGEKGEPGIGGDPKLENHLTYYVSLTGNDNNNGLSPLTSFATIQKFIDTISLYDLNGYNAICTVIAGTYTDPVFLKPLKGVGRVYIEGQSDRSIISVTSDNCFYGEFISAAASYSISDFILEANGGYGNVVSLYESKGLSFTNLTIKEAKNAHFYISSHCSLNIFIVSIAASATAHIYCDANSTVYLGGDCILSNDPNFSEAFICAEINSLIFAGANFTGTATGMKYKLAGGSQIILENGNTETSLPGSLAGAIEKSNILG